jgi:hypothetical protein
MKPYLVAVFAALAFGAEVKAEEAPVVLDCGLTVHGNVPNIDKLCLKAKNNFVSFLDKKNIKVESSEKLHWRLFVVGRFHLNLAAYRNNIKYPITGLTERSSNNIFILRDKDFEVTFLHEMFHVMSISSKLYLEHSVEDEERLAEEFTEYLGYGK